MDNNEVNKIVFEAVAEKLNVMEGEDEKELCEKLAKSFLDGVDSDDEALHKVGRRIIEAVIANNLNDFCVAVCGWEPRSLLTQSGIMTNEEQEDVYAEEKNYSQAIIDLISAYEDVYSISYQNRVTEWFGDYAMNVRKSGITGVSDELFDEVKSKALAFFGTDEVAYRALYKEYHTRALKEERFLKLKDCFIKGRFSLVSVAGEENGFVDGIWIQDFNGDFRDAVECARETEKANSGRITVAVVEWLGVYTQDYNFKKGLKRLD